MNAETGIIVDVINSLQTTNNKAKTIYDIPQKLYWTYKQQTENDDETEKIINMIV